MTLPLNAWLVESLGARKLYLLCLFSFLVASCLCALSRTMPQLIAARVAQGCVGGLLVPLTRWMIARTAGRQLPRVAGIAGVPILLAPLVGPLFAGVILKHLGWRWLFYVNLPVGIVALALALRVLPEDGSTTARRRLDIRGFLLLAPGLACLLYGLQSIAQRAPGAWLVVAGVSLCTLFVRHAARGRNEALIDLELFANKTFAHAALTQFLNNGILYAGQFIIPLYLILGSHLSAPQAGGLLGAMGLGMLSVYPWMGRMTDAFGARAVVCGGAMTGILGISPFLWMTLHQFRPALASLGLLLLGVAQGATAVPTLVVAYTAVPPSSLGLATMSMNIIQRLGGPVLTTLIAIAASSSIGPSRVVGHALAVPLALLAAAQLLVTATASRLPGRCLAHTAT